MPRTGSFRYSAQARCELDHARDLLADVERQGVLHPLIVQVRRRPPRPGVLRSYLVTDRLAAGPFRFRTTYQADTLRIGADDVELVARQWPGTTVHNHTRLTRQPDGRVRIDVEITLTAPTLLFRYAFQQARAAHLTLAERLPAALES